MPRLPDAFVADLRSRMPIDDVIADYVDLKQQGPLLVGLCPFHSERTPSFKVKREIGRYHCYGCGSGGDVFDFLQNVDGLNFREAIDRVADAAGVTVPADTDVADNDRFAEREVRAALADALTLYSSALHTPAAKAGQQYLADRAFTPQVAAEWQIGYSPLDESVIDQLRQRHNTDILTAAGLVKRSDHADQLYDPLRGRLVWPLHDKSGRLSGFAGRSLTNTSKAKYRNSDESPIFHKRRMLYGLWAARRHILTSRSAIVVEGYTDVMAFATAGFPQVVATCGTAFTPEHSSLISGRVGDEGEVISGFDNDDAGRAAAWALFLHCQHFTSQITAVDYSAYGPKADACEARQRGGDAALQQLMADRTPLLRLLVAADCDVDTDVAEQVAAAARAVSSRLRHVVSPILRRAYLAEAATLLGLTIDELTTGCPPPPDHEPAPTSSTNRTVDELAVQDEVTLAATLIAQPDLLAPTLAAADVAELAELFTTTTAVIVEVSLSGYPAGRPFDGEDASTWGEFMQEVLEPQDHPLLWQVAFADIDTDIGDRARRVRRLRLLKTIESTRADPDRADDYLRAHRALKQLRSPAATLDVGVAR